MRNKLTCNPVTVGVKSLTVLVSFSRADSTPGKAVHVCSFSPALRFGSSFLCGISRSSSPPNSPCSLLKCENFPPSYWCLPSADENSPSAKMQDAEIIMNPAVSNSRLLRETSLSHHQLAAHAPLITQSIFHSGPSTAAPDWSGPE